MPSGDSDPPYFAKINVAFVQDTPSIDCVAFKTTSTVLLIVGMTTTKFLCYFRVCAVWRWNRFIVGFFTVSWICVAVVSGVTAIYSTKAVQVETYCTMIIVEGRLVQAPFIVAVINHTLIVMAITYGVCKNTLGRDHWQTFGHGIMAMLGKSLPTFSKTLLHDSQITYMYVLLPSPNALKLEAIINNINLELLRGFL